MMVSKVFVSLVLLASSAVVGSKVPFGVHKLHTTLGSAALQGKQKVFYLSGSYRGHVSKPLSKDVKSLLKTPGALRKFIKASKTKLQKAAKVDVYATGFKLNAYNKKKCWLEETPCCYHYVKTGYVHGSIKVPTTCSYFKKILTKKCRLICHPKIKHIKHRVCKTVKTCRKVYKCHYVKVFESFFNPEKRTKAW